MRLVVVIAIAAAGCGSSVSGPDGLLDPVGDTDTVQVDDPGDSDVAAADNDPTPGDVDPGDQGDSMPVDSDPGPPKCTALLCDDFETMATIDSAKWDTLNVGYAAGISVTVQQTVVKNGANAAYAHIVDDQGGFAILENTGLFPQLQDELWGRMSFYTTVSPTAGHTGFIYGFANGYRILEIGYGNGTWQTTRYLLDSDGYHEWPRGSANHVPLNTWTCLEWHFNRLAASGDPFMELYVNGALTESYTSAGEQLDPLIGVGVGIDDHSANPPSEDDYLDDVAIDDARIGCLP